LNPGGSLRRLAVEVLGRRPARSRRVVLNLGALPIYDGLALPFLDAEKLVAILMHFLAELLARPECHEDERGLLPV
jgi:hypothetical protein